MTTDAEKNKQLRHWREGLDSSPYLGAHDLPGYEPIQLVIREVKKHMSKDLKENAVHNFAYFTNKNYKPMLLNATNNKVLAALTGTPFYEKWKNIKIEIYVERGIKAFGEVHDGLRIRNKKFVQEKGKLDSKHPRYQEIVDKVKSGKSELSAVEAFFELTDEFKKAIGK